LKLELGKPAAGKSGKIFVPADPEKTVVAEISWLRFGRSGAASWPGPPIRPPAGEILGMRGATSKSEIRTPK
jgi:hypothetical protein